jgi:hypothetical protein
MKTVAFVFLLALLCAVMHAQTSPAPPVKSTIAISAGTLEYCLGPMSSPLFRGLT